MRERIFRKIVILLLFIVMLTGAVTCISIYTAKDKATLEVNKAADLKTNTEFKPTIRINDTTNRKK